MKYFFVILICLAAPVVVFAVDIDTDQDGLSDMQEAKYYTDVNNPDTDGDGYPDGTEVKHGYSPHAGKGTMMHEHDYDNDGLNDWLEGWFNSDRGIADTDGDGHSDFDEVMRGYKPNEIDPMRIFSRHVEVDKTIQRLYYFVDGVKILNMPVSTGNPWTETPSGEFEIQRMIANKRYVGADYDLPDVPWNMLFRDGGYYIHGAYWHNDFGWRTHSHGCVNMRIPDAEILYKYIDVGVPVRVYGDTPPNRVVQ